MVTVASNHSSGTNTYKVAVGDFNNDGRKDIASIDWGTQSTAVDVYLQNTSGGINQPISYNVNHSGYDDLTAGDVTGDGRDDIVVMSGQLYATPNFGVLAQNAAGTFSAPVYYNVGTNILTDGVAIGDINGDSRSDVVVTSASRISSFTQNTVGALAPAVNQNSYSLPETIKIVDVNNDGLKIGRASCRERE